MLMRVTTTTTLVCECCNRTEDVYKPSAQFFIDEGLFDSLEDYILNGLKWEKHEDVGWICPVCTEQNGNDRLMASMLANYDPNYRCRDCKWEGYESDLIEGDDGWGGLADYCPHCGSSNIDEIVHLDEDVEDAEWYPGDWKEYEGDDE